MHSKKEEKAKGENKEEEEWEGEERRRREGGGGTSNSTPTSFPTLYANSKFSLAFPGDIVSKGILVGK